MFTIRAYFVLEFVTPNRLAACAVAFWVACLRHKAFYNPVKDKIVVVAIFRMCNKVLNCFRTFLREQLTVYFTLARIYDYLAGKSLLFNLLLLLMSLSASKAFILKVTSLF